MVADLTHCICATAGTSATSPLCSRHWQEIPSALKIAWSQSRTGDRALAERLTAAVRDYARLTIQIDDREKLKSEAGRNRFRRADFNNEIEHLEKRGREILDKWSEKEAA